MASNSALFLQAVSEVRGLQLQGPMGSPEVRESFLGHVGIQQLPLEDMANSQLLTFCDLVKGFEGPIPKEEIYEACCRKEARNLPPPFGFKAGAANLYVQDFVLPCKSEDKQVIPNKHDVLKHVTASKKIVASAIKEMCFGLCCKIQGTHEGKHHPRVQSLVIQHLLEQLPGYQIKWFSASAEYLLNK